jgi:hypothetical protein
MSSKHYMLHTDYDGHAFQPEVGKFFTEERNEKLLSFLLAMQGVILCQCGKKCLSMDMLKNWGRKKTIIRIT